MKAILKSLVVVGLVAGLTIGATRAYFSDEETSTGNTFIAGTIDLAVNDENPWVSKVFTFTDVKPSHELTEVTIKFKNVGNNEGTLKFEYSYEERDKEVDDDETFEFAANNPSPGGEGYNGHPATRNPAMEMTADQFARLIYVVSSSQDGCDNLANLIAWADKDPTDGKVSLYELVKAGPAKWYQMNPYPTCGMTTDDTLDQDQVSTVKITLHLAHAFTDETGSCSNGSAYTGGMDAYTEGLYCIYQGTPVIWNVPQADGLEATVTATLSQVGAP